MQDDDEGSTSLAGSIAKRMRLRRAECPKIPTGLGSVDRLLSGGLRRGEVVTIALGYGRVVPPNRAACFVPSGSAYGQDDRIDVATAGGDYTVVFYGDQGIASRGDLTDVEFSRGTDGASGTVTGSYTDSVMGQNKIDKEWNRLSNGILVVNFSTAIPDGSTLLVGVLASTDGRMVIRGHSESGTIAGPVDGGAFQARRSQ